MIAQENYKVNGVDFVRSYSTDNRYIVRDGVEYIEACDPAELGRTYTEGDVIPVDETEAEEILNILMGAEK